MRVNKFKTVAGDIKFGADGEITGSDVEQFRTMGTHPVLAPVEYNSGSVIYPFEKAQ
jgi:hypothetical protein